ncbi:MAG: adenosylcobinamide-GDP ribazoletransferase [Sphingomonadales bacterium]|nr:MAG: adenosylcobinamide-GDP ribazoletransferase [Sphingomonadales bacterium]
MRRIVLAFQFLTRLPMPRVKASEEDFAASMRWFPLVGLVIGAIVAAAHWAGAQGDPWLAALVALVVWVWITGALHLDGLSDLADGMGAAHGDRQRLLEVMRDPHVGSFGVTAIALQLIAKLILLHALIQTAWIGLALVPFAARMGPLVWSRWLLPLSAGLGARFVTAVRPIDLSPWFVALVAACWFSPSLALTPVLIAAYALWLERKLGGVSGDCHGAGIELLETGLLLALVIAGSL